MYNSLNTVDNLFYKDPDVAHEAMYAFGNYLRGNMDSLEQKQPIRFDEELRHTRQYLHMKQLRFGERLRVEFDVPERGFLLPALTLQPLVENSVRHGVTKRKQGEATLA